MSITSGSIQYKLTGNAALHSFPFVDPASTGDEELFTPSTLNIALGGSDNGVSSSLLGSIIGEGVAATFISGSGWQGSVYTINPAQAYWIRPATGVTFSTSPTIDGLIKSPSDNYNVNSAANLISYPFTENKSFSTAVDTVTGTGTSLQDIGVVSIVGLGVAATYNTTLGWVGNLVTSGFTTGSGYWFRFDTAGSYNIWSTPTGSSPAQEVWNGCTDWGVNEYGAYGYRCYQVGDATTGWEDIPESPYSQSAHTFGHKKTMSQNFYYWSGHIGNGPDGSRTGSLFDSASSDMSGSQDGTNNFIVGFFSTASLSEPYPACCGATVWHDHQDSFIFGGTDRFIQFCLNGDEIGPVAEGLALPNSGDDLAVKIYDPRRNLVVTGSVHNVVITNGTASIGDKTTLTYNPDIVDIFVTASDSWSDRQHYCIKMDS